MSNEQQVRPIFTGAVATKTIQAGHASSQSGPAADDVLGLGPDLYATGCKATQTLPLDGCGLNAN